MAMFGAHLLVGTVCGGLYGCVGLLCGFSLPSCLLSAWLVAVASLLPDLDTKSIINKELSLFLGVCAAILAALYLKGRSVETAFLCGLAAYAVVRYVVCGVLLRFARHRGALHSVMAAAVLSFVVYLALSGGRNVRAFEGFAIFLGYIGHLLVDEVTSFGKESFGSALKLFGDTFIVNVVLTISLVVLVVLAAFH